MSLASFPAEMSRNIFFETYGSCKTFVTSPENERRTSMTSSVSNSSLLKPPTTSSNSGSFFLKYKSVIQAFIDKSIYFKHYLHLYFDLFRIYL